MTLGPGPLLTLMAEQGDLASTLLEEKAKMRDALQQYLIAKGHGPYPTKINDPDLQKLVDEILYSD